MLDWTSVFRFKNRIRNSISLSHQWPEALEIRVAEKEDELEKAFRLLHTTYVREGLIAPQPSEMRVLPQQLLPQSSMIIALWEGKIAAAVSLIRDNPIGLPLEQKISLKRLRQGGKCLAEISLMGMDPMDDALEPTLTFPVFRYLYQYATRCFGIQEFVIESSLKTRRFYRDVLLFERMAIRSSALCLDLEKAPERWGKAYEKQAQAFQIAHYLASEANHPGSKIRPRVYGIAADLLLTPQMLESLYLKKAGLLNTLKREEVRALRDAYPHESFDLLLAQMNWSELQRPMREIRLDTQMSARIVETEQTRSGPITVRNISRHGLQLWTDKAIQVNEVLTLEVKLNESQFTRLCAQVKWKDESGFYGLRILSYSAEWGLMVQSIETQFTKLAAVK